MTGLGVRTVISDDHASSVSWHSLLLKKYRGNERLFIYHSAYSNQLNTSLFVNKNKIVYAKNDFKLKIMQNLLIARGKSVLNKAGYSLLFELF